MDHIETAPDKTKIIEALIFASDEPLTTRQVAEILRASDKGEVSIRVKEDEILAAIRELNATYVGAGRSFRIIQVAGGFQGNHPSCHRRACRIAGGHGGSRPSGPDPGESH